MDSPVSQMLLRYPSCSSHISQVLLKLLLFIIAPVYSCCSWCSLMFFGVSFKDQGLARKRDLQRGSFKSNKVSISEFKSCKYAMFWKPLELWWQFLKEGFNLFSQLQNNQTSLIFCFFFILFKEQWTIGQTTNFEPSKHETAFPW